MVYFAVYIYYIYIFSRVIVNENGNYTKNELYTVKNKYLKYTCINILQ